MLNHKFLIIFVLAAIAFSLQHHLPSKKPAKVTTHVKRELDQIPIQDLPQYFWWGNHNGTNYLTLQRNQHIPVFCGSCWAFATTSALSDRIKIKRKAQWPDIHLSPQVLLSCDLLDRGCGGGDTITAYEWIFQNNITD